MAAPVEATRYIWRRNVEREPSRWVWWVIAGLITLCGFGAFAAYMAERPEEIPTFLGLGVIGSVFVWSIPRVYAWGRRRHPDIILDGRDMVWAKKRVPIDQVERWTANRQVSSTYNGTTTSRMTIGVVRFALIGAEKDTAFTFPHLTEAELAELIVAVEAVLPGRRTG